MNGFIVGRPITLFYAAKESLDQRYNPRISREHSGSEADKSKQDFIAMNTKIERPPYVFNCKLKIIRIIVIILRSL